MMKARRYVMVALIALGGCGSSSGAKRPEECKTVECPVCPPAPKPGPKAIVIGEADLPHDRARSYDLQAIAADGKSVLVRVEDELAGDFYQQLDLSAGPTLKAIKVWPFQGPTEAATKKQALKALKPEAPWPPSQKNAAGLVALAADEPEAVAIYLMKDERAVKVAAIARLKDEAGAWADVAVTRLAWDPSGTRLIVVHHQTLAAAPGFSSDWVHVVAIDPATLPF